MTEPSQLPERLRLECFLGQEPLSGGWVHLTLVTLHKNPFNLVCGPADANGVIEVDRAQLLKQAEELRDLFLMDYSHPEKDSAGLIWARTMNVPDMEAALCGYQLFKDSTDYPPEFDIKLGAMVALLRHEAKGKMVSVRVTASPSGSTTIQTSSQPAV